MTEAEGKHHLAAASDFATAQSFRDVSWPRLLFGSSVTLHRSSLMSDEIGTTQANSLTDDDPDPQVDGVKMRMAGYHLESNLALQRWRLRPFASARGSLTTYLPTG